MSLSLLLASLPATIRNLLEEMNHLNFSYHLFLGPLLLLFFLTITGLSSGVGGMCSIRLSCSLFSSIACSAPPAFLRDALLPS